MKRKEELFVRIEGSHKYFKTKATLVHVHGEGEHLEFKDKLPKWVKKGVIIRCILFPN